MGKSAGNIDWITCLLAVCISMFGLFVLLTVDKSFFSQQSLFLILGLILALVISRVDVAVLYWLGPIFYVVSIILLIIPFLGPEIRGAQRWILIGTTQFQPSELIKPLLIVSLAWFISLFPPRNIFLIPFHLILFLIIFAIIFRQPDLGTAIIIFFIWIGMMLAGGLNIRLLIILAMLVGIILPLFWNKLEVYQKNRLFSFINPDFDPTGAGYNAIQAVIAVGSGEIFGRGLGRGTQSHLRFLPEFHTDFIFATLIEEFGFLGGILLLIFYFVLLWRILYPLLKLKQIDVFGYLCCIGVFCMILSQVAINIGMNMGLVPVTGITLPLVSYGGSSILATFMSIGLLWSVQRNHYGSQNVAFP